ncbi:type II toxin-antitoxin system RelE family toxin [Yersinia pseudotuberculosis]|uniref:Type II toxin-antitoxin system RelE/ParE family toxin n=1 Tax=Yersinia pseudotuberculosis TaxID=633 RepID=A0ABM7AKK5_YERPU|nr:type II toxin-antitoxin system RelE/ParE family toxin [Yersinia pseudotuberculosis]AXY33938.1 type II toxin-antitoxin system RelE/ParE family toxin [Yersinia pseudotuberculosis]AYW87265.1 type II toxin-antitoxin system RelE/ParE family toxin [Yersinia pseudotuberculosis]AYW92832.1 type II toxin-antitoxin system RelE/ParE family toxin [Yersinia pseudotuberculosis]AYX09612.1 type II toxin-antitoxin system RelE/ParE family toxin [Yersinia pseudotuberculosis]PEI13517.1 type II toxin-antitoxin s
MVTVQWTTKARKQLLSIDTRYRKAISEKVNKLETFPAVTLDIKKLHSIDNQYRLRVGDYRVIFELTDGEPVICSIRTVKRRTSTTY